LLSLGTFGLKLLRPEWAPSYARAPTQAEYKLKG